MYTEVFCSRRNVVSQGYATMWSCFRRVTQRSERNAAAELIPPAASVASAIVSGVWFS